MQARPADQQVGRNLERLSTKQQEVRREREAGREESHGVVFSHRPVPDASGSKKECSQWSSRDSEIIRCVVAA